MATRDAGATQINTISSNTARDNTALKLRNILNWFLSAMVCQDEMATAMSDAVTGMNSAMTTALNGKQDKLTASTATADAAANAATNAPTNLNVVTTLLGSLTGEVNATKTKQNDLATKYNDLATKFNFLLAWLRSQGLKAAV